MPSLETQSQERAKELVSASLLSDLFSEALQTLDGLEPVVEIRAGELPDDDPVSTETWVNLEFVGVINTVGRDGPGSRGPCAVVESLTLTPQLRQRHDAPTLPKETELPVRVPPTVADPNHTPRRDGAIWVAVLAGAVVAALGVSLGWMAVYFG